VVLLQTAKRKGWVHFPDNDIQMFGRVFPLQLLFLISTVCSLGGTIYPPGTCLTSKPPKPYRVISFRLVTLRGGAGAHTLGCLVLRLNTPYSHL
jgi:hypothetical protein